MTDLMVLEKSTKPMAISCIALETLHGDVSLDPLLNLLSS